jgi:predicted SnoaL-like aldol condensation-catalyzing enzyme
MKKVMLFFFALTGTFSALYTQAQQKRNLRQEAENKRIAADFFHTFYNDKNMEKARKMMLPDFVNHHPHSGKGAEETINAVHTHLFGKSPEFKVFIKRIVAEGDLVWIQCYTQDHPADHGKMSMDIWRIENGKIAEHWDIIQDIPADVTPSSMFD